VTMRWAGHVARVGSIEMHAVVCWEKSDGWSPLERSNNRWKNNIETVLKYRFKGRLLDSSGSRKGPVASYCERTD
jgi:hypothetical protein